MPRRAAYAVLAALVAVVLLVSTAIYLAVADEDDDGGYEPPGRAVPAYPAGWVGTWSAPAVGAEPGLPRDPGGVSVRNVVHTSVGGSRARIEVSNLYGTAPLPVTHATVALAAVPSGPAAVPGTMRRLTFGGRPAVTVPPGGWALSDPVGLGVPAAADLLVTTYSPAAAGPVTFHPHARELSYLARGDRAGDTAGTAYTEGTTHWRYLTAVDVWTREAPGAVVVIGDSITDGVTSTPRTNRRWTDYLARRLRTAPGAPRLGVLNQGISGNRVLADGGPGPRSANPSGLSRFDRDVLSRTGVRAVVVALGVNDILRTPHQTDPSRIVAGLAQLTARAHARGLRVVGATLTPFHGHRGFTPRLNAVREQVNELIRAGGVFDAVVDFDQALRDPALPLRLYPAYDSGDHLHPGDRGYAAMARALDLGLLGAAAAVR
ncbi:SGNH/GDSL hydrolase family protein [Streptomyces sp. B1866]|uniref:SGNH/GDSL hydrolase family protein n=1 Tax=Streptomyces sp. B1866 TaxID=3075431 RepID=UPI00288E56C4|nr:SGNH/GDSL hydrolase family protein [Streptomyces sp. B1866]MDT3396612.1 SGNH/GDSL hydrolase family protein [Streptomyces sp. B1866]